MPRYFFDVDDGEHLTSDIDGQEMESLQAAQNEAIALLPDIARMVLPDGDRRTIVSVLRTDADCIVLRATLSLSVERFG